MSVIDEILEKIGLKYSDLDSPGHSGEKEQLLKWVSQIEKKTLSIEDVKKNIALMKFSVEKELVEEPEFTYLFIFKIPNRKHLFLKARLKNYMLLEVFFNFPENAKKSLERYLASIIKKR